MGGGTSTKQCPHCKFEIPEEAKACGHCGRSLSGGSCGLGCAFTLNLLAGLLLLAIFPPLGIVLLVLAGLLLVMRVFA